MQDAHWVQGTKLKGSVGWREGAVEEALCQSPVLFKPQNNHSSVPVDRSEQFVGSRAKHRTLSISPVFLSHCSLSPCRAKNK